MTGKLVILSGPSGVGKDTIIDAWSKLNPLVRRVVAYTTRSPRPGEVNKVDYHFVPPDSFDEMVSNGAFLEHKRVHDHHYATPLHDLEEMLKAGQIAVLKIDVQGAISVMGLRPDARSIFLHPPSFEELERRIRGRGTEDEAAILKRLQNARDEIAFAPRYHLEIVNEDPNDCIIKINQWVNL